MRQQSFISQNFRSFASESKTDIHELIKANKVMVFSKTTCGFCSMAKSILDKGGVKYTVLEMNKEADGRQIQQDLYTLTKQRTVPNTFINGTTIGGFDDMNDKKRSGELKRLLDDAGVSSTF